MRCVVVVVAQAAVDDVAARRVGQFGGHGPVVFFYGLFRLLVFTAYEPVAGLGGRAHQHLGHVGGHGREHARAVVGLKIYLLVAVLGVGCQGVVPHAVADAVNIEKAEGWQAVDILETAVEHGDGHAAAAQADAVQALASEVFYLLLAAAVALLLDRVPGVEVLMVVAAHELAVGRVGRHPHQLGLHDKRQGGERAEGGSVGGMYDDGVVPPAGAHDVDARLLANGFQIAWRHGQVGAVEGEPLALAALHALGREPPRRVGQLVGRESLVAQCQPVHILSAARIFHLVGGMAYSQGQKG